MTQKAGSKVVRIEHPGQAPKVFQEAFNAGNLDGLVNLFEPEAVIYLGPDQMYTGSAEIRGAIVSFLAAGWRLGIKLITHCRVGDIALNTVEHTLRKNNPDGSPNMLKLRAAVVFRRQADGSWRFLIDNGAPFE